jgi:transglutaminase-like putative cysteine protease
VVRLRPAPHSRTRILSYSMKVEPAKHFINWQQDPQANYLARLVFPDPTTFFRVEVDLVAEMAVYNPFDFFLEPSAEKFPFAYEPELLVELAPYLRKDAATPLFTAYLARIDRTPRPTSTFLFDLNRGLQQDIAYLIRMEHGVQTPEVTLANASGSCRDTAWLLVQLLRHLGLAARFASGYLIQLKSDVKALDGPSGTEVDFTDLHAAPDGSGSTRPRGSMPARATSRSRARPSRSRQRRSAARSIRARRPSSTTCRCAASGKRRASRCRTASCSGARSMRSASTSTPTCVAWTSA